jgi:hypothetical protein
MDKLGFEVFSLLFNHEIPIKVEHIEQSEACEVSSGRVISKIVEKMQRIGQMDWLPFIPPKNWEKTVENLS